MSQRRKRQRNNTIAGLFVLASVIGFVLIVILLSDMTWLGSNRHYEVWFKPDLGTPGLTVGSEVTLAGVAVGRVDAVELETNDKSEFGPHVVVTISLPANYILHDDAVVGLVVPMLGTAASINLEGLGTGKPISESEPLTGIFATSPFLRSVGLGPKQIEQIKSTIGHIDEISGHMSEITKFARDEVQTSGKEIVQRIRDMTKQISQVIASIKETWPTWRDRLSSTLVNADESSGKLNSLLDEGQTLVTNANEGVAELRKTIDRVASDVTESAANVRDITAKANGEWSEKISNLLDRAESGTQKAEELLSQVGDSLTALVPELERILANTRIASDNLKLVMIEIRNEPWRLLAAPSERAVQESLLYDSVRTYANAVSDLDASIAALKAVHDRYGSDFDLESESVKRILSLLDNNYSRFDEAQKALFDFITKETERP